MPRIDTLVLRRVSRKGDWLEILKACPASIDLLLPAAAPCPSVLGRAEGVRSPSALITFRSVNDRPPETDFLGTSFNTFVGLAPEPH